MTSASDKDRPAVATDRLETALTAALVATSVFLLAVATQLPVVSRGSLSTGPGPGLFPIVSAALLLMLAVWHLVVSIRAGGLAIRDRRIDRVVPKILIAIALGAGLLKVLGFFLDMTLMVAALMWLFGERRWLRALSIAALAALLSVLVFGELFGVRLPELGIPVGPWTL